MLIVFARFGQFRAEAFRVHAHESGARRLAGAFFRKRTWCQDIDL